MKHGHISPDLGRSASLRMEPAPNERQGKLSRSVSAARLNSLEKQSSPVDSLSDIISRTESLRQAHPYARLHLSLPSNIQVSPVLLAQALEQDLERTIAEEASAYQLGQPNISELEAVPRSIQLDQLDQDISKVMTYFCKNYPECADREDIFGQEGRMALYLKKHCEASFGLNSSNREPLIKVLNGLKNYGKLLNERSIEERQTLLGLFPPRDQCEYQCLHGMYQRQLAVNNSLRHNNSVFQHQRIGLLVTNALIGYMNDTGWYAHSYAGNHIHLVNNVLAHLGVSSTLLKKIDGYYYVGDAELSAEAVYELQMKVPNIILQLITADIRSKDNLEKRAAFETVLNAFLESGMDEKTRYALYQHPYAAVLTGLDGEIELFQYLRFARDEFGQEVFDHFEWDWLRIQAGLYAAVLKEYPILAVVQGEDAHISGASYQKSLSDQDLSAMLSHQFLQGTTDQKFYVLSLLSHMSHPKWPDASLPVFLNTMAHITHEISTLSSFVEQKSSAQFKMLAQQSDQRYQYYLSQEKYAHMVSFLVDNKAHVNKNSLVRDLIYYKAPLYLIHKALRKYSKLNSLSLPLGDSRFTEKMVDHPDAAELIMIVVDHSKYSFQFSQKEKIIEACFLSQKYDLAMNVCEAFSINPVKLFQWPPKKLFNTAKQWLSGTANKCFDVFLAADHVVEKLSRIRTCLPTYAEWKQVPKAVRTILDAVDWPGQLKSYDGSTPLMVAVHQAAFKRVEYWLLKQPKMIFRHDIQGWTALHHGVQKSNLQIVKLLVAKGSRVNEMTHEHLTPLSLAVVRGKTALVRQLLNAGAQNKGLFNHMDPFLYAVRNNMKPVVQLMLEKKFNMHQQCSSHAYTPFEEAVRTSNRGILKAMLEAGADPNALTMDVQLRLSLQPR